MHAKKDFMICNTYYAKGAKSSNTSEILLINEDTIKKNVTEMPPSVLAGSQFTALIYDNFTVIANFS